MSQLVRKIETLEASNYDNCLCNNYLFVSNELLKKNSNAESEA